MEDNRMEPVPLTDLQLLNFEYLIAVQRANQCNPVQACYEFSLDREQAALIASKSVEEIRALAFGVNQALAVLKFSAQDLNDLFSRRSDLVGLYAAVRELRSGKNGSSRFQS
jgi:hypothetical protein